jgi:integrase
MSYIEDTRNIDSFLENQSKSGREIFKNTFKQFGLFTEKSYQKNPEIVLEDVAKICRDQRNNDKFYTLMSQFAQWLLQDHPDIVITMGNKQSRYQKTLKKKHPNTVRHYVGILVLYFEDQFKVETSRTILKKRINLPKVEEEDPEPFTKAQVRKLIDHASSDRKVLYMTLKDSGMRIGETCQLRKSDFDTTGEIIKINIKAKYTKEKKAHSTFVTRETKPMLLQRLESLEDNDLVFGTNEDLDTAVNNEEQCFYYLRDKLGLTEKYNHNGRYKKTLHSFRSYCATQANKARDENWAHALLGHKRYLQQYIRNQEDYVQYYAQTESHLMIYEKITVVDSTQELENMKEQMKILMKLYSSRDRTKEEIAVLEKMLH